MSTDRYYNESMLSNYNDPVVSEAPYLYFAGQKYVSVPGIEGDDDFYSEDDEDGDNCGFTDEECAEDERLRWQEE